MWRSMRAMIECSPVSVFSWCFRCEGRGVDGLVSLRLFGEQGELELNGDRYQIVKNGFFSGSWEAGCDGRTVGVARKRNAFTRTFDIDWGGVAWELGALGLGRTMRLHGNGGDMRIAPLHPFTRRCRIEGDGADPALALFGLWLTALTWRRSNGAAAGGT